jgi:putative alpha-1,2-mannosidase
MISIRQPIIAILSTFALLPLTGMAAEKSPVDWVDPRIDTVKPRWFYFASASRPFGMVNLSPDTNTDADWNSGYRHGDDTVQCLSHVHCWQLAGIAVMPLTAKSDPLNYASKFSHDDETIRPGYHKLFLQTHGVTTELTSTTRVGFHRHS